MAQDVEDLFINTAIEKARKCGRPYDQILGSLVSHAAVIVAVAAAEVEDKTDTEIASQFGRIVEQIAIEALRLKRIRK